MSNLKKKQLLVVPIKKENNTIGIILTSIFLLFICTFVVSHKVMYPIQPNKQGESLETQILLAERNGTLNNFAKEMQNKYKDAWK